MSHPTFSTAPRVPFLKDYGSCQAKAGLKEPQCGQPADTTRKIEAAPALWVCINLCHAHQISWDRARQWTHAQVFREEPCRCSTGEPCPRTRRTHKLGREGMVRMGRKRQAGRRG